VEIRWTGGVAVIVASALALGGCASRKDTCAQGEQFVVHDTLSFGTGIPRGGVVSPEEWQDFLQRTVTPRFPRGFATMESSGQWRHADGSNRSEASHVLVLDHPADAVSESAVLEIISTYKSRFQQEAVFRVKTDACISY
jgi:hypothetical protein